MNPDVRLTPSEQNQLDLCVPCHCGAGKKEPCRGLRRGTVHFARRLKRVMLEQPPARQRVWRDRNGTERRPLKRERGLCPVCRINVSLRVPRGGDGSLLVVGFHHGPTSFDAKRCPGVGREP